MKSIPVLFYYKSNSASVPQLLGDEILLPSTGYTQQLNSKFWRFADRAPQYIYLSN